MGNFQTHARYSWVLDKKEKKKGSRCVKGAIAFLISQKGAISKKSLGNPSLQKKQIMEIMK